MTAVLPPRVRTLAETRDVRPPLVDLAAHDQAHPAPVFGCPWCSQSEVCGVCQRPSPECPDRAECRRREASAETSWRDAA